MIRIWLLGGGGVRYIQYFPLAGVPGTKQSRFLDGTVCPVEARITLPGFVVSHQEAQMAR